MLAEAWMSTCDHIIDISPYCKEDWSDISDWPDFLKTLTFVPKYVACIQTDKLRHVRRVVEWYEQNADDSAMVMWLPQDWHFFRRIAFSHQGDHLALELKLKFGDILETDPVSE